MLKRTVWGRLCLGPTRPPGARAPHRWSSSLPYTIGCANRGRCTAQRVHAVRPLRALIASSIPVAVDQVSCAWRRRRDGASRARTCSVAFQRRSISSSYSSSVPCVRFDVSTERLARATGQSTLPASASIFMIDLRKSQRKSRRVNPKSAMASVITAHRAEVLKVKEELGEADAYAPPLIFLVKTDDTKKQAERRQEQMDAQLQALGAFGEFRVCVLDGTKSRHWTRYIDPPTTPEKVAPGRAEAASGSATDTASVVGAAVNPMIMSASPADDEPARPVPTAKVFAVSQGANHADTAGASAAASSPLLPEDGAAVGFTGVSEQAGGGAGEEEGEEVWEEIEVEVEDEEDVERDDSGGISAGANRDASGAETTEAHAYGRDSAVVSTPTVSAAHAEAHKKRGVTAPCTTRKSVNPVWAHVKSNVQDGDGVAGAAASVAAAEALLREHESAEEEVVDVAEWGSGDGSANAASPAVPDLAAGAMNSHQRLPEGTCEASSGGIPDAPQWSAPERRIRDHVFLATAHAPLSAEATVEAVPLKCSADAGALAPLEELEEFDIDAPLDESGDADAPAEAARSGSANDTPGASSKVVTKHAEPAAAAAEPVATVRVSGAGVISAADEIDMGEAEEATAGHTGRLAEPATAGQCLPEGMEEEATAFMTAGAAGAGRSSALSSRDSAITTSEENPAEAAKAATATEDHSSSQTGTVETPSPPVRPPKPSIPVPVYPQVPSRLYYGVTTVYLSDRAYIELPATANVLVIDHLDWDDAHLAAIDAALELVDPVAGHVLLYAEAYAPQSEQVMGDMNAHRRSLLPFIFVFRTQLSAEAAMEVQRRLTNALHVRPTLVNAAQRSLVAGKHDRTSVCVLNAAESERGGENPMLAPQPRKVAPTSPKLPPVQLAAVHHATVAAAAATAPRHEVDAPLREKSTTATVSAAASPHRPSEVTERRQRGGGTVGMENDAEQQLWTFLNQASFHMPLERNAAAASTLQVAAQRSCHDWHDRHRAGAAEVQPQVSVPGASSARGNNDQAAMAYTRTAGTSDARMTGTGDDGEVSKQHVAANAVGGEAPASQSPRLAYASTLLSPQAALPLFNARASANAGSDAAAVHREVPAATLVAEEDGSAAVIKRGLFNFGAIAFGKDNGYYAAAAVPRRRRASRSAWDSKDTDDEADGEPNVADAADGAAASSVLGSVSDLGLYPVSESVAAARAEAARNRSLSGGGSPFSDEEIAKIEEGIILAQFRKMERKEKRIEARRAKLSKAKEAKARLSSQSVAASSSSPSRGSPVSLSAKLSRTSQQRWRGSRSAPDTSKTMATAREEDRAEDKLLEDFISSLLVSDKCSNEPKTKVSMSSAQAGRLVRSARCTLAKAASSTREGRKR
ncbi:hypothetical protein LSCM1_06285 [Leishmania martiniquensis]|uniref:Uncharacterized protein n=1 Tax=Leishmania martiniquensis TaxID=1580590 RepID=A0A836HM85_9TRYP|nr:hypothetical protein LSCM1_06285 [Leishmania martiniquensis]